MAHSRLTADDTLCSRTNLSVDDIIRLLKFCLSATYMSFRGQFFQQLHGTAMGSPVSVSVANLVMEDVEERALASYDVELPFWKRYVDDVCTVIPRNRVQHFLQHLNNTEPSIQFTAEIENNSCLPFLDLKIQRSQDGSLSTSVFRKPTHTDQYLNFASHHPLSHKRAVVNTLCTRAATHSSCNQSKVQELNRVSSTLRKNGYPMRFIMSSQQSSTHRTESVPDWKTSTVLPYVKGVSESIRRILTPLKVRISFKPCHTLRSLLSKPKDQVPAPQRSGVVYKIPCAHCQHSYIGQTGRRLCQRVAEHKRAVKQAHHTTSALSERAWSTGHPVDWDNVSVLNNCPDYYHRLICESFLIRSTAHTLNRDTGSLPTEYDNLV